jgi:hypothetical protein
MHCICIDPAHVEKMWPLVRHYIATAMENGGGDFEKVQGDVLRGDKLLWIAADEEGIWAGVVTGLHIENGQKFCVIWACGGREKDRWLPLISVIEKFAKDEGCASIRVYGRKGWGRALPDYNLISITLEKAL